MKQILLVGAGGFLGAVLRYSLAACCPSDRFASGTLLVNTLGCLVIGAVVAWVELRGELEAETRALLVVGVLGSLTTFSAFGDEVMSFAREGRALAASGVVLAHLTLGLGGVVFGRALATWALR
ncbi:MAG: CrcB family protein [Planctomycetes bacterium]|nr:CrcB family protein [Planctomycetota bacterium]